MLVDDDRNLCDLVERFLTSTGHEVKVFHDAETSLDALGAMLPDAVLLDLNMPGMDGLETLETITARHRLLPVIMLTADTTVSSVVRAVRLGAYDYIGKPVDKTKLLTTVGNAVERARMSFRLAQLEREIGETGYGQLLGESEPMKELYRQMDRVAASDITLLIHGESGSGKELVAKAIHQSSGRRQGPFVALNCAAIPETMQESEIFGHEKGAFTGAIDRHRGKFEQADGGSLFMDEVAELSPTLQAKLLRAIQEKRFHRLGGSSQVRSDFRLMAATHRNLLEEVKRGNFREDLYFRIAVFELEVPALRDRGEDIRLLAEKFLVQYRGSQNARRLSKEVVALLNAYPWPGNVRELENIMQRCLLIAKGDTILPEDLPSRLRSGEPFLAEQPLSPEAASSGKGESESDQNASALEIASRLSTLDLKELERQAIEQALVEAKGNLSRVVRMLGIGRTTLYRKLKTHKLR